MERREIEQAFLEIASSEVESGKKRYRDALRDIDESLPENNVHSDFQPQMLRDSAGENFGFSSEHLLKSNIIFDDFSRSPLFTQSITSPLIYRGKEIICPGIGTPEWRMTIAGEGEERKLQLLSDPKLILSDIIKACDPSDPRSIITNDDKFNADFLTLKLSGSAPKGHSLYAYYQLLHPVVKSLINSEFFTYVDDEFKYTIYALLTEDILKRDSDTLLMPKNLMEKLDSVKAASVNLRYASISGRNISDEELAFLKEFTGSLLSVSEYRFPLQKTYGSFDFNAHNFDRFAEREHPDFMRLDKIQKYYLQSNFSSKELNALKEYIYLLRKNGAQQIDIDIFVSMSIYFKNYVNNVLKIKLNFEEVHFSRIFNYCNVVKAYQPFDAQNKRLCDNPAFSTEEKRKSYIMEIKERQQKKEIPSEEPESPFKPIDEIPPKSASEHDKEEIKKLLQRININDWLALGYDQSQIINMTRRHAALLSYDVDIIKDKLLKMEKLGYNKQSVLKITSLYPKILDYEIEHYIKIINKLLDLGYSDSAARTIILKFPALLLLGNAFLERRIQELMMIGFSKEDVIKITGKNPNIFALRNDVIKEKKTFFDKMGIRDLISNEPSILSFSIDYIKKRIDDLKELGYSQDDIRQIANKFPAIFIASYATIKKKFNVLINLGYSREEVITLTTRFPSLFNVKAEKLGKKIESLFQLSVLKEKIKFYDALGIAGIVASNPSLLDQDLELSYARYMFFIKKAILISEENYMLLFMSNDEFKNKYGIDNSKLLEEYRSQNDSEGNNRKR